MKEKRNLNIELLRIYATFLICCVHSNISIYGRMTLADELYYPAWFCEIACIFGVNIFGLISGYIGINKHRSVSRLVNLWLKVIYYNLIGFFVACVFFRSYLSSTFVKFSLLPLSSNSYWYITSYAGLYLFAPVLNAFLETVKKEESVKWFLMIILLTAYSNVYDLYGFGWGYSTAWLIALYLLGGLLKIIEEERKAGGALLGAGLLMIGIVCNFSAKVVSAKFGGIAFIDSRVLRYSNIFSLLASIGIMLIGLRFRLNKEKAEWAKALCAVSSSCFGVYILQCHPLFWNEILERTYLLLTRYGINYVWLLPAFSAVMFAGLVVADQVLMKLLKGMGRSLRRTFLKAAER